jgi:hypothetical protein
MKIGFGTSERPCSGPMNYDCEHTRQIAGSNRHGVDFLNSTIARAAVEKYCKFGISTIKQRCISLCSNTDQRSTWKIVLVAEIVSYHSVISNRFLQSGIRSKFG